MDPIYPKVMDDRIIQVRTLIAGTCEPEQAIVVAKAALMRGWGGGRWISIRDILNVTEVTLAMRTFAVHLAFMENEYYEKEDDHLLALIPMSAHELVVHRDPRASLGDNDNRKIRKAIVKLFGKW